MIKAIGLRKIDITEEEFFYYQELVKKYSEENNSGARYFENLFETNKKGIITIIKPQADLPWEILFFIQNIMIAQHLREYENRILSMETKLKNRGKNDK